MKNVLGWAVALGLAAMPCLAQEEVADAAPKSGGDQKIDSFDFIIGGGFVVSPEFKDYIDDVYESSGYDTSGGGGWLDLYVGAEIRPAPQFGVIFGCDFWINGVDATTYGGPGTLDETYANVITIPSVYGQLYFTESRLFYINGGISLPLPSTGSDYFEFENNGLGLGANIGVELADLLRIEGGYSYVPVTAKATSVNPVLSGEKDYNFGGFQLRLLLAF